MSMPLASTNQLFPKRLSIVALALTTVLAVSVAFLVGYMNENFRKVHQEQFPILEMASINVRLVNTINLRLSQLVSERSSRDPREIEELKMDIESLDYNLKIFRENLAKSAQFKELAKPLSSDEILTRTNAIAELLSHGRLKDAKTLHDSAEYQKLSDGFSESVADLTESLAKIRDESMARQLRMIRGLIVVFLLFPFLLCALYIRIYRGYRYNLEKRLEAELQRKQLIHILCHDLGNPVAAVTGFVGYLENAKPELRGKAVEMIRKSAVQAQSIIDMVRKMQALESGKLALEMNNHGLAKLVQEAVALFSERAKDKGVDLSVNIDPSLEVQVEKTSFVNSVVNNLLSNAIKFSKKDSRVEITAQAIEGWVQLSIRDHGIGMSSGLVEIIFDETKASSRTGTSGEAGTGFGMPLAKKFVLAYGGELAVLTSEAQNDHGTEFKVKLKSAA